MAKNIIIFSDATGQAGGITFDENRTNVYKLYRACRVGPDTVIYPWEQVAFYDPGLGSPAGGSEIKIRWARTIYNFASKVTGLGITANIIDCYAALIRLYREGDRIFLVGFSRGAYTVRSLAGVISYCGIPRHLPGGASLPMDINGSRILAKHAVKDVYQFCSSYNKARVGKYKRFMLETREAIAKQFRAEHGSSIVSNGEEKANVFPYFIGVFDTVAALGHRWLGLIVTASILALSFALSFLISLLSYAPRFFPFLGGFFSNLTYWKVIQILTPIFIITAALIYLKSHLKWAPALPGHSFWKRLATIHLTQPKHKFEDLTLNENVNYAKHAISIDENRKDFKLVRWAPTAKKYDKRDAEGNLYFEQVWFPGVHADIGGGYEENESRLSDGALRWMLAAASVIPNGLKHDENVLRLHPDPSGTQHNEQKDSGFAFGLRKIDAKAIMHKSVYARFAAGPVVLFDKMDHYRPANLSEHVDFVQYYDLNIQDPYPADPPQEMADDIEAKWDHAKDVSSSI